MLDAMGHEIELGGVYGYSNRSDGFVTVIVGRVKAFTNDRVTLDIDHRGSAVYNKPIERDRYTDWRGNAKRKTVAVYSNLLFPLANDNVAWIDKE